MPGLKKTFNRFSLDQKLLTLIVIEVIGFCIVALVAITQLRNVGDEVEKIAEVTLPLHIAIENIRSQIMVQHLQTREIIPGAMLARDSKNTDLTDPGARTGAAGGVATVLPGAPGQVVALP